MLVYLCSLTMPELQILSMNQLHTLDACDPDLSPASQASIYLLVSV